MKKKVFFSIAFFTCINLYSSSGINNNQKISIAQARVLLEMTNEYLYQKVLPKYKKSTSSEMSKEGWTASEIKLLKGKSQDVETREKEEEEQRVQLKPYDPSLVSESFTKSAGISSSPRAKVSMNALSESADPSQLRLLYTTDDRKAGRRIPGLFRHNALMPTGGRTTCIAINPNNPDSIMVIGAHDGIWKTNNMGKHWDCISDNIPDRFDRSSIDKWSLPVDPLNWKNVFAFTNREDYNLNNNRVYKTTDGGNTWKIITGANHKSFRRTNCFRDSAGRLKFIGITSTLNDTINSDKNNYGKLYLSDDSCKTWSVKTIPDAEKDTIQKAPRFLCQDFAFDPTNRNLIYVAGTKGILRSIDGGATWSRMTFNVYRSSISPDSLRLSNSRSFPLSMANGPMLLNINPNNGLEMFAAVSSSIVRIPKDPLQPRIYANALYKTIDGGANWITVNERGAKIGQGAPYGLNELTQESYESPDMNHRAFVVNFKNPYFVCGGAIHLSESNDSGVKFTSVGTYASQQQGIYPDGNIYDVSCCDHNADQWDMKAHRSGRVYRACDAGFFVKDPLINANKWTNISGDMGIAMTQGFGTNEFGDFSILTNNQDIYVQTYRGGRWGTVRGYEGHFVFVNPFSNEESFINGQNDDMTSIENVRYISANEINVWTKADVCTGNWYMLRKKMPAPVDAYPENPDGSCFSVVKDFGKTSIGIDNKASHVIDFALSRDVVGGKLFIIRDDRLYVSTNSGSTFNPINTGAITKPLAVAVNPNDSREIYLAGAGYVYKTSDGGLTWQNISAGLDLLNSQPHHLYYHEGRGDLYFVDLKRGIYIKEANNQWTLWMAGYNKATITDAQINYTTQEMIISHEGRGIWIADLEHPADRYLSTGFGLKQCSNINNFRTFGINVPFTIPMYYTYKWSVNDSVMANENGQYFTSSTLKSGDRVKLTVTLRESPDVTTSSAEFIVPVESTKSVKNENGNCLYSNGLGRVDLGYVDHFFGDFSLQMWVKPNSDGVILANRQMTTDAVKGFYVAVKAGRLNFTYSPANNFLVPKNETQKATSFSIDGGAISMNVWSQVTITHKLNGNICLYINGVLASSASQKRELSVHTLNNSLYLSLFADAYEMKAIDAAVDELKIWNGVLDLPTIYKSMYGATSQNGVKLVYYNDFNASTLDTQKERFSQCGMAPRMTAQVKVDQSILGSCSSRYDLKNIGSAWSSFAKNTGGLGMDIKTTNVPFTASVLGLVYEGTIIGKNTNLQSQYYTVSSSAFGMKMFGLSSSDLSQLVDVKFNLDSAQISTFKGSSLYTLDLNANTEVWSLFSTKPIYDSIGKSLTISGKASDLNNKRFVFVNKKPGIEFVTNSPLIDSNKELMAYTPEVVIPFQATVVGGAAAPKGNYALLANNSVVKPITPLVFSNNIASTSVSLGVEDGTAFNNRYNLSISGQDLSLAPYNFSVINKVTPKTNTKAVSFIGTGGGGCIGTALSMAGLQGKNTLTFMTWIRLEDPGMLSSQHAILSLLDSINSSALFLNNGTISFNWLGQTIPTNFKLTPDYIGQWIHVAVTYDSKSMIFYLNGKTIATIANSGLSALKFYSGLGFGQYKNTWSDFKGAFDQIAVWNRALLQQEIVKYMHSRILLNEAGLVTYVPFESMDPVYRDLKSNAAVVFTQNSLTNQDSNIPFNFVSQQVRTKALNDGIMNDGISFTLPSAYTSTNSYYTTKFAGLPYNCIDINFPDQVPLEDGFRTISFGNVKTFTTERIQFTVQNPNIIAYDSLVFYARPLGAVTPFTIRYAASAQNGSASFDVPATVFNENLSYMFFVKHEVKDVVTSTQELNNLYHYTLSVDDKLCKILNLRGNANITVFDLYGRTIVRKHTNESKWSIELPKGAYLVKIEELGTVCMTKISL